MRTLGGYGRYGWGAWALIVLLAILIVLCNADKLQGTSDTSDDLTHGWPASTEYDELPTLESGAQRWSMHETLIDLGVDRTAYALVDHQTGVMYLMVTTANGGVSVSPILESDGTPCVIAEAGE